MVLNLESRRRIYETIEKNPGIHFRELLKILNMNTGELQYHLNVLIKNNLISEKEIDNLKVYFPIKMPNQMMKTVLSYLRNSITKRIIINIAMNPGITLIGLYSMMNTSKKTLINNLTKLKERKIIREICEEKECRYYLYDEELIINTLTTYRESLFDELVGKFMEFMERNRK
ncbi:MAG: winged helix-turn-helix transcriptional regulator [Thermoplasmata archaeon]